MIHVGSDVCQDPKQALRLEWLETNGLGGYASSTIAGANMRRYHGLLMAATRPPAGRVLLLSKLEETVVIDGRRYELSCNRYTGALHPKGFRYLRDFRLDPFPVFVYDLDGLELEKRIFMVDGENTTVIEYQLSGPSECRLEVRPLIAFRDFHSTTHCNDALNATVDFQDRLAIVRPYEGLPKLYLAHTPATTELGAGWYYNFEFDAERERGLDFQEDLYNPLALTFRLGGTSAAALIASIEPHSASESGILREREIERRKILAPPAAADPLLQELTAAADQFIVRRGDLRTIIAGYHWFDEWGRDTMIALPGLTLVTGRYEVARQILMAASESMDQGMLPNYFTAAGETAGYNTVDATLWFFQAVHAYTKYTAGYEFIEQTIYPKLKEAIDWHLRGTRYGIHVDDDGLLVSGEPGVQLTWMDAKVGDWVVTPRHGKPVEVQALWYNALRIMEGLAHRFGDADCEHVVRELAGKARDSFNQVFWNERAGCLYDNVNAEFRDPSIRPNQIFAVSLPYTMMQAERARSVVEVVDRELRTPLGLRTLSPKDPQYRPRYEGDVRSRDSAYHQGTVWPWLMGPFITAYVAVNGGSESARSEAASWLAEFRKHLRSAGLGQISEIADAEEPYHPRGAIAQAWSVAELVRAATEDVYSPRTVAATE